MSEATLIQAGGKAAMQFTAAAALTPGEIITLPDGRAGVVAGLTSIASGDPAAAHIDGEFQCAKLTSDDVAAGATIYWDQGNARATTTASTHVCLGKATAAYGTSSSIVRFNLNQSTVP